MKTVSPIRRYPKLSALYDAIRDGSAFEGATPTAWLEICVLAFMPTRYQPHSHGPEMIWPQFGRSSYLPRLRKSGAIVCRRPRSTSYEPPMMAAKGRGLW